MDGMPGGRSIQSELLAEMGPEDCKPGTRGDRGAAAAAGGGDAERLAQMPRVGSGDWLRPAAGGSLILTGGSALLDRGVNVTLVLGETGGNAAIPSEDEEAAVVAENALRGTRKRFPCSSVRS